MSIETIYGNLQGLKPSQFKQLQKLYHQRISGDRISTVDLAERIANLSTELKQPLSVYLNRRGQVIRVGVGTPRQTQIPPLELPRYGELRLSGIRCLSTSLKPTPPSEASLTAMVRQRLDALVILTLTGQGIIRKGGGARGFVDKAYLCHLLPLKDTDNYWDVSHPQSLEDIVEQDFLDLVNNLEAEFSREFIAQEVSPQQERVLLVGLHTGDREEQKFQDNLQELALLVDSAGGKVLATIEQKRSHPHPQTLVGAGKVEEIALQVQTLGANLVVFDRDLSPAQVRNLELQLGVRVVDRTEVILDIFAQRAQSRAGKLQVELAQLEYMLPRLTGRGQAMSRLGGGIGTRGPGETKLETERRAIQKRITRLQQEVNQLQSHRSRLRQQRQAHEITSIAIVGYTNAGKSTLINTLTNADVYTADQLFATLDPTTRRLTITDPNTSDTTTLLMTDTVGFIHELPPPLVDSFRATLEEVTEADALLHVVDLSHPAWESHIESVKAILAQMPLAPSVELIALNKIDKAKSEHLTIAKEKYPQAVFISAQQRHGLTTLRDRLLQLVASN
ncbi:GTPase HflX [Cyanobacterium aponinum]|uniref:GTPase HflX n=1 Tax=Cyanobacterium aponinum (strain PCC 10605) TaxID=755178 RepID=K9Z5S6_CYAAP|nr:GTPase HflX [Cyanobacterium aponinum]AFZ53925.1 GTP-binding protein HflX [Cyanobacterium aponinum PCC 10605]